MSQKIQDNLFKALGLFIEAMRPYVVHILSQEVNEKWPAMYFDALTILQKENWNHAIKSGTTPENLIDFHNLKGFSLKYKDLLREDFGKKINSLPTWFEEIAEIRNKCYHHQELDDLEIQRGFNNIQIISKHLKMDELEVAIRNLQQNKEDVEQAEKINFQVENASGLIPWFHNVKPHMDIRQGNLDESVFAANLAEVALGNGREIYQNPITFFSKTFFTLGLKTVARRVIKGLNGQEDAENRVISLQTGFGGGKTHTLISLYHIARMGDKALKSDYTKTLIEFTGEPKFSQANIAVFTNTTNDPTQGRNIDGINIKTFWGEIAFQLGGKEAYSIIKANDENRTSPKGLFKKVLEKTKPALILIDELADYCVAASGIQVGASSLADQTISFIQELSEAVSGTNNCVMVATLPASDSEVANSAQASQILTSLTNRLTRVGADTKPVADEEIFEVIRWRLFENLGNQDRLKKLLMHIPHYIMNLVRNCHQMHPNWNTRKN